MAPIPRADLDMDNPSSDVGDSQDQDSPLRRQFSEPFRPQSTSTQISQSPEPLSQRLKCDWCGKLLDMPDDEAVTRDDVLNAHVASDHPASNPMYDGVDDSGVDHDDELEFNDEEDEEMHDAMQLEEGEEMEDGEEMDEVDIDADEAEAEAEAEEGEDAEGAEEADQANQLDQNEHAEGEFPGEDEAENVAVPVVNGHQAGVENNVAHTLSATANVPQEAPGKLDMLEWLSNPRTAFPEDYRRRVAQWQEPEMRDRLPEIWNVHDVNKFSPNYEEEMAKVESTWQYVFGDSKFKKRVASEPMTRPNPYKNTSTEKGKFLDIGSFDDLLEMLRKPEMLSPEELYAATETVAFAMRVWQDEYIALDKLYNLAHRHHRAPLSNDAKRDHLMGNKKKTGQPLARVPETDRDFEDKKEAMLYGYKHTYYNSNNSTAANWTPQSPFIQGGFVPTPAQGRKLLQKTAPGDRNPDGWTPIERDGVELVPKLYEPRREPVMKFTRKRKAVEVEASKSDSEDTHQDTAEGEETEEEPHPAKRRTRGRGGRRGAFEAYQPPEPPAPTAPRGRGRGRGRGGRGRGTGRSATTGTSLDAAQPTTYTPTSYRGRGRRGASAVANVPPRVTHTADEKAAPLPAASPMPESAPATNTPPANSDQAKDDAEEARRRKIAMSKNPKRTKAMLDHWERFNREGRIRNPKRSKAQIESDRQADEARKSTESARPAGRRRKSQSLAAIPAGNLAPKTPAVAPMPSVPQMASGPTLPALSIPHYPPPNPYNAPPPVGQLGQPMAPQYAPFPYVQYTLAPLAGPPPRHPPPAHLAPGHPAPGHPPPGHPPSGHPQPNHSSSSHPPPGHPLPDHHHR